MTARGKAKKEESFEEGLGRLEEIVQRLEGGELMLEESLRLYEEGVRLTRVCSRRLEEAEKRIEILGQDRDGELHATPADPEAFGQKADDAEGEGEAG